MHANWLAPQSWLVQYQRHGIACDTVYNQLPKGEEHKLKNTHHPVVYLAHIIIGFAALMFYLLLGVFMDAPAAFITWLTGLQLRPAFNAPYLSTSNSNFWSKRWNSVIGDALRSVCFDPVHEGWLSGLSGFALAKQTLLPYFPLNPSTGPATTSYLLIGDKGWRWVGKSKGTFDFGSRHAVRIPALYMETTPLFILIELDCAEVKSLLGPFCTHAGRLLASKKGIEASAPRSAAAVCWTFFVSGVMHELVLA